MVPWDKALAAVFFDMDGVLVDVSMSYRRAVEETAALFIGRSIPPGTVQEYKNRGGFNDDWKLTYAIIQDAGVDASFEEVVDAFQIRYRGRDWDGFIRDETPLFGTATLQSLADAGVLMAVVTGRPIEEAAFAVKYFGWEPFFPVVVAAEHQAGRGKPDPYPLELALAAWRERGEVIDPSRSAYLGDTVDDMVAARSANFYAVGCIPSYLDRATTEAALLSRGAHLILDRTTSLPDLVLRMPATSSEA